MFNDWYVLDDFHAERIRAHAKHGNLSMENNPWDDRTGRRMRILLEELGEVARELNDAELALRYPDTNKLYTELVQTGAMILSWADSVYEHQLRNLSKIRND